MTSIGTQGDLWTYLEGRLRSALIDIERYDAERLRFDPTSAADNVVEKATLRPIAIDWSALRRSEPRETTVQPRSTGGCGVLSGS